jgi:hypothetical protein
VSKSTSITLASHEGGAYLVLRIEKPLQGPTMLVEKPRKPRAYSDDNSLPDGNGESASSTSR